MISRISVAALMMLVLVMPAAAQQAWAPWAIDEEAPTPQTRPVAQVERVAEQVPQARPVTPATRAVHFERFWLVGSFR